MPASCVFPLPSWYRRRCSACGDDEGQEAFGFNANGRDGLRSRCNACRVKEVVAHHRAHPERQRARQRRWKKRHPEEVKVRQRIDAGLYYERNKTAVRAKVKARRDANPEKQDAYWKSDHGRMVRRLNEGRRRTRAAAAPASLTVEEWRLIVAAFDGLCAYGCGARWEEIDHVLALSRGGGLTADNVLPACGACNVSKHARSFEDFCAARGLEAADILARALSLFRSRSNRVAA